MPYVDPILKAYADLISANTNVFKKIYFGDPIRIQASVLPALIIAKRHTQASTFTNTEDQHLVTLVFTVITDIRKDIQDDKTFAPGTTTLYDLMEGRDPDTFLLKSTSLMGILRHNINVDAAHQVWTDVSSMTKADYGLVINKRQEGTWSIEGTLSAVASVVQSR